MLGCDKQSQGMHDYHPHEQLYCGLLSIASAVNFNGQVFTSSEVVNAPPSSNKAGTNSDPLAIQLKQSIGLGHHYHQLGISDETPGADAGNTQPNKDSTLKQVNTSWRRPGESTSNAGRVIQRVETLGVLQDATVGCRPRAERVTVPAINPLMHGTRSVPAYGPFIAAPDKLVVDTGILLTPTARDRDYRYQHADYCHGQEDLVAHLSTTTKDKSPPAEAHWKASLSPSNAARQTRINESDGVIHRLMPPERTIHFDVDTDSFSRAGVPETTTHRITRAAQEVAKDFERQNLGITFAYAPGPGPKVFSIRYDPGLAANILAQAFFPSDPREGWQVRVSRRATLPWYVDGRLDYIESILAHEFAHVLGFRHWNAGTDAGEMRASSMLWPNTVDGDRHTIMNTGVHSSKLRFSEEDFRVVRELYSFANGAVVRGLAIRDVDPYDGRYVL